MAVPIRSRTATSTGMRDVVRAAADSNVYRWRPVLQAQFDITTGDLEAANRGLAAHEAAIARAQMRSNCHGGWSCKEVALAKLRDRAGARGASRRRAGTTGGTRRRGRRPGGRLAQHAAMARKQTRRPTPTIADDHRRGRLDAVLDGQGAEWIPRCARCRPLPPLDAHGQELRGNATRVLWGERGSSLLLVGAGVPGAGAAGASPLRGMAPDLRRGPRPRPRRRGRRRVRVRLPRATRRRRRRAGRRRREGVAPVGATVGGMLADAAAAALLRCFCLCFPYGPVLARATTVNSARPAFGRGGSRKCAGPSVCSRAACSPIGLRL